MHMPSIVARNCYTPLQNAGLFHLGNERLHAFYLKRQLVVHSIILP